MKGGMLVTRSQIRSAAERIPAVTPRAAESCAWLQACRYPGIRLLMEAFEDPVRELEIGPDAMGLDLKNVSCVFIGPQVIAATSAAGRFFLRNVRHGLYLVPLSVEASMAIGCPIDLNFGLGGQRRTDPYSELLQAAEADGIEVEDEVWAAFEKLGSTA
jgi:hypothetical protein